MNKYRMISDPLPGIPWQERPEGLENAPVWRYSENPIIKRNPVKGIARIFNSAVIPWKDGYAGVFRAEAVNGIPLIHRGFSRDGVKWEIEEKPIPFVDENGAPAMPNYAYDPRLVKVEDTYYVIWCTDFFGAAIGMAKTKDFETFTRVECLLMPYQATLIRHLFQQSNQIYCA